MRPDFSFIGIKFYPKDYITHQDLDQIILMSNYHDHVGTMGNKIPHGKADSEFSSYGTQTSGGMTLLGPDNHHAENHYLTKQYNGEGPLQDQFDFQHEGELRRHQLEDYIVIGIKANLRALNMDGEARVPVGNPKYWRSNNGENLTDVIAPNVELKLAGKDPEMDDRTYPRRDKNGLPIDTTVYDHIWAFPPTRADGIDARNPHATSMHDLAGYIKMEIVPALSISQTMVRSYMMPQNTGDNAKPIFNFVESHLHQGVSFVEKSYYNPVVMPLMNLVRFKDFETYTIPYDVHIKIRSTHKSTDIDYNSVNYQYVLDMLPHNCFFNYGNQLEIGFGYDYSVGELQTQYHFQRPSVGDWAASIYPYTYELGNFHRSTTMPQLDYEVDSCKDWMGTLEDPLSVPISNIACISLKYTTPHVAITSDMETSDIRYENINGVKVKGTYERNVDDCTKYPINNLMCDYLELMYDGSSYADPFNGWLPVQLKGLIEYAEDNGNDYVGKITLLYNHTELGLFRSFPGRSDLRLNFHGDIFREYVETKENPFWYDETSSWRDPSFSSTKDGTSYECDHKSLLPLTYASSTDNKKGYQANIIVPGFISKDYKNYKYEDETYTPYEWGDSETWDDIFYCYNLVSPVSSLGMYKIFLPDMIINDGKTTKTKEMIIDIVAYVFEPDKGEEYADPIYNDVYIAEQNYKSWFGPLLAMDMWLAPVGGFYKSNEMSLILRGRNMIRFIGRCEDTNGNTTSYRSFRTRKVLRTQDFNQDAFENGGPINGVYLLNFRLPKNYYATGQSFSPDEKDPNWYENSEPRDLMKYLCDIEGTDIEVNRAFNLSRDEGNTWYNNYIQPYKDSPGLMSTMDIKIQSISIKIGTKEGTEDSYWEQK